MMTTKKEMTSKEMIELLLSDRYSERISHLKEKYLGSDIRFEEQIIEGYDIYKNDYLFKYHERLNDLCMILDKAEDEGDIERRKIMLSQIKSHEKTEINPILYKLLIDIDKYFYSDEVGKSKRNEPAFLDYIHNVKDKEVFALELKELFNTETNTSFGIMINLLEIKDVFKFSEFAPFYRKIKQYFNREIGNQNTINDALNRLRKEIPSREREVNKINDKVNVLIDKHKN